MRIIRGQKYLWNIPDIDHQRILAIATKFNLSIAVAQTLVSRGFTTIEDVENYLFTSLEKDVAHPALLKDAQKAVARIIRAINNQEKILIFGDYDVDGITSSALMMLCLKPVGAQINFFLPNRMKDGYGLSVEVVERAAHNGYSLIITVDNGITAFQPAKKAQRTRN